MTYIALLRGINVSGQKIIKMELLTELFQELKFTRVRTYIQSGNILFESNEKDKSKLSKKIRKHLLEKLGHDIPVFLRTAEEFDAISQASPFSNRKMDGKTMLYVSFLEQEPDKTSAAAILQLENKNEFLHIEGTEVYSLIRKDATEKILFTNMLLEKKAKQAATTRNINTVEKLAELAKK